VGDRDCLVETHGLTVAKSGDGAGTVMGTGIDCGDICSEWYRATDSVTLMPYPEPGSRFDHWEGCPGSGACNRLMTQDRQLTAVFTKSVQHRLTVTVKGPGRVSGGGIDCGAVCALDFNVGTVVHLGATPASGYELDHWSGACSGRGLCNPQMVTD